MYPHKCQPLVSGATLQLLRKRLRRFKNGKAQCRRYGAVIGETIVIYLFNHLSAETVNCLSISFISRWRGRILPICRLDHWQPELRIRLPAILVHRIAPDLDAMSVMGQSVEDAV